MSIRTYVALPKMNALILPPIAVSPRLNMLFLLTLTVAVGVAVAWLPLRLAVLLVGGTVYITLVLLRPTLGLYLLIIIIPFSSRLAVSAGGFRVGLMELVLAISIIAWALKILASRGSSDSEPAIREGPFLWLFVIFIGAVSLSWLNTLSIGASLVETVKWVEMLALYLLIVNLLPVSEIKWVVLVLIITGLVQAGLGLYQFVFRVGPAGFELFDGRFLRAYGTFDQPNPYGGYLGLILPLVLSLTVWQLGRLLKSRQSRFQMGRASGLDHNEPNNRALFDNGFRLLMAILLTLSLSVLLAALFASQSRGAWLGFAAAAMVTLTIRSRKSAVIIASISFLLALYGLISSFDLGASLANNSDADGSSSAVTQRVANAVAILSIDDVATTPVTDANFATIERLAHWQAAREMWRDNPWLGVGFGNYAAIYPAYAVGRWLDPLGHAHNYFLNLGAETGLVGMSSYLIFWFFAFGLLWMAARRGQGFYKAIVIGGLAVLVHLHVHSLVDNLYVQGMYLHVAIILGLAAVIYTHQKNLRAPR